ncbi:MAG: type III secretion system export apparatus subunit SctV [Deltaproteobacteria bacterium]|jgi:type III secretion protein V|nr:type III secretion system export apparatus subunit SctV [Deltaproteobacteria bacterium]
MSAFSKARVAVKALTNNNDLTLVALMVAVIAMMILPLPTFLVDLLIGTNLALSFMMLMMTMYVGSPLEFSSFPTMLLFTTLFRLGLNITTTRLILLQADAGEIIFTFGEFAVGGNFIVGAVVFIIITIVQFVVIAKGAERVSEVGARFTLDAMPGKQMSIDADLRAGVITMADAQARREVVSRESQMYGAMDGAMKFVKGDSIAGLIVAAVNIVAGTIIGVTQNGLTAGESLQLYGVLTIGDGLVSQIPSLLVAISAGILVTRGGGKAKAAPEQAGLIDEDSGNVGAQIGAQIFGQPKAIMVAGALVFLFALVPGFPKPQLLTLAFILLAVGRGLKTIAQMPVEKDRKVLSKAVQGPSAKSPRSGGPAKEEFAPVVPIILDLSHALGENLDYDSLNEELIGLRRALYFDLGVPFPGINVRPDQTLEGLSYVVEINEIPLSRGALEKGLVLVRESPENLKLFNVMAKVGPEFIPGLPSVWVKESDVALLARANIRHLDHARIISYHLSLALSRHAAFFVGLQESKRLLDKMEERAPDLVRELTRLLPVQRLAELLQRLIQERVSIRDLRSIMEALIEWAPKEKDVIMLVEHVRGALKRQISYAYSGGLNLLPAIVMDPQAEEVIRKAIRQTSAGSFLALSQDSSKGFLASVRSAYQKYQGREVKPVLLASLDIRRYVRRLIENDFYDLPVVSYQEITPEITVQPLERVRFG